MEVAMKKATEEIKKQLDKQQGQAQKFATDYVAAYEGAASKVGGAVTKIAGFATKAAAAIGAATVGLGAMGVAYNTQIESYEANMGVLLGSTQAGIDKVAELADFAASTPFELSTLADATSQLLAFGVQGEESTEVMGKLGDISLGNADKFGTLISAYGKMSSSQKVSLESINMMIESGFNPLALIADETGESMEQLNDRISKGTLSYEEVTAAIDTATSSGGQFYNGMAVGANTTSGLLSTLKDTVSSQLGNAFASVSDKIKDLLPRAIEFVESLDTEAIGEQIGAVIEKVVELTENAIAFVENIDFAAVGEKIRDIYDKFVMLSPVIAAVVTVVTALYAGFKLMMIINTIKNAMIIFNAVLAANPIILIVAVIAALIAALIVLWTTNEDFRNAIIAIWNSVVEVITNVVNAVVTFFTVTLPNAVSSAISAIGDFFTNVLDAIKNLFSIVPNLVASLPEKFKTIGKNIVDGIWQGISEGWTWLTDKVSGLATDLFDAAKNTLGIHSPSKKFAWLGEMSADGFGVGFDEKIGKVKSEVSASLQFDAPKKSGKSGSSGVTVYQTINSTAKTAADLMQEAIYQQRKAVLVGV